MASEEHEKKHDDHGGKDAHGHGDHGGGHGGGGHGGGHEDHEEHEGAPEWLISFADNVSLMMGFFVILLAMNMGPKGSAAGAQTKGEPSDMPPASSPDMLDFAIAVREAFNNPVNIHSTNPKDEPLVRRLLQRRAHSEDDGPIGDRQKNTSMSRGEGRSPAGEVMFDHMATNLNVGALERLDAVADYAKGLKLILELRGHASTDEAYHQGDNGIRLSFERTLTVAKALVAKGVDWKQIRMVPCGDMELIERRAQSRDSHAQNERVEILVTNELVNE